MSETHQPGENEFRVFWPETLDWEPFAAFPTAARLAVLVGDPSQPGAYVVRPARGSCLTGSPRIGSIP